MLSVLSLQELVYGNMNVNDPVGWIAERLEWWVGQLRSSCFLHHDMSYQPEEHQMMTLPCTVCLGGTS
jgi:hypothetical protein